MNQPKQLPAAIVTRRQRLNNEFECGWQTLDLFFCFIFFLVGFAGLILLCTRIIVYEKRDVDDVDAYGGSADWADLDEDFGVGGVDEPILVETYAPYLNPTDKGDTTTRSLWGVTAPNTVAPRETARTPPNVHISFSAELSLPEDVRPIVYDLRYMVDMPLNREVDINTPFFTSGFVKILIRVKSERTTIELHAQHLKITKVKLAPKSNEANARIMAFAEAPHLSRVAFSDGHSIEPGDYQLTIMYTGGSQNRQTGFFKSLYADNAGNSHYAFATNFKPDFARQFVPCFDEPRFRASWRLLVFHPPAFAVASSMPVRRAFTTNVYSKPFRVSLFDSSPPMAPHTFALFVHEYSSMYKTTTRGLKIGVHAPAHLLQNAVFALETAVKLVEFLERAFRLNFSLPKLDIFSLKRFEAGGNEGWGLITINEDRLLLTARNKQQVIRALMHELVHQWFGCLVSVQQWEDAWLHEGMATFFEVIALNVTNIEMPRSNHALLEHYRMIQRDANYPAKAIVYPLISRFAIARRFDNFIYGKAAHLLWVVDRALTDDVMYKLSNKYLKAGAFQSKSSQTFVDFLAAASPNFAEILQSYIKQAGIPVVTMTKVETNIYEVSQQRLYFSKKYQDGVGDYEKALFAIPLLFMDLAINNYTMYTLKVEKQRLRFTFSKDVVLPIMDLRQHQYAVANYGDDGWKAIFADLKIIPHNARRIMYIDLLQNADFGLIKYDTVFDIYAKALRSENNKDARLLVLDLLKQNFFGLVEKNRTEYATVVFDGLRIAIEVAGNQMESLTSTVDYDSEQWEMRSPHSTPWEIEVYDPARAKREEKLDNTQMLALFEQQVIAKCTHPKKPDKVLMASRCIKYDYSKIQALLLVAVLLDPVEGEARMTEFLSKLREVEIEPFMHAMLTQVLLRSPQWKYVKKILDEFLAKKFVYFPLMNPLLAQLRKHSPLSAAVVFKYITESWRTIGEMFAEEPMLAYNLLRHLVAGFALKSSQHEIEALRMSCPIFELREDSFWSELSDSSTFLRVVSQRKAAINGYLQRASEKKT